MTCCVLDCSAALAWVLPGEHDAASESLLEDVAAHGATVPGLWPLEVANVLLTAARRGRITLAERHRALALLGDLSIHIEPVTAERAWTDTLSLADARKLTAYDASYLESAIRLDQPLGSRDRVLRKAARDCGIRVVG